MSENTYNGSCFCGAVQLTVSGAPAAMGYCHCESCRHWSAGPVNAFTLWPPASVQVTQGADNIESYAKTDNSHRKWCKTCGGHVFTEHPGMGPDGCLCCRDPGLSFSTRRARLLRRNRAAYPRRYCQTERCARRNGRLRRSAAGIVRFA